MPPEQEFLLYLLDTAMSPLLCTGSSRREVDMIMWGDASTVITANGKSHAVHSRHKSVDTLRGYVRDAELFKDHAGTGLL